MRERKLCLSPRRTATMIGCKEGVRSVFCDVCQETIYNNTLKRHIMQKHIQDRQVKCQLCAKSFISKEDLKRHMPQHTETKEFTCNICQKSFNRMQSLKIHTRIHSDRKTFQCKLCPKTSKNPIQKVHMFKKWVSQ